MVVYHSLDAFDRLDRADDLFFEILQGLLIVIILLFYNDLLYDRECFFAVVLKQEVKVMPGDCVGFFELF